MRAAPIALAFAALSLPAAAQTVPAFGDEGANQQAVAGGPPQIAVPAKMPPPLPTMSPSAALRAREARALAMATRWRQRSCGTTMGADGVLEVQQGACEPALVCAVNHWCDVSLEPGEGPTDMPDMGDPRWQFQIRWAVEGMRRTMHLRFRPTDAGLSGNFVFTTNHRTVSLRLLSTQRNYMPFLKLANPNRAARREWAQAVAGGPGTGPGGTAGGRSACDEMPAIPPSAFDIDVPRAARPWAPIQVYGVTTPGGARTCIEFPANIGDIDLPMLVVRDTGGTHQLVTSQMVGRRMEVDALVGRAELVTGVGFWGRTAVKITRKGTY